MDEKKPMPSWLKPGEAQITPETAKDLEAEGISVPKWAKEWAKVDTEVDEDTILGCMPFTKGTNLMMDDNLTGKCGWCDRDIQFRPHAAHFPTKVCVPCLEQATKEPRQ